MHGIIHKALKDMVTEEFGEESWQKIELAASNQGEIYIGTQSYSDDVTYGLIISATKELGVDIDVCLERFGEYWILDAAPSSYADVLNATSSDIIGFFRNINSLHDRITSTFPLYIPPEFSIQELGNDLYEIHYISTRKGLCYFVIGLLKGVGKRFNKTLEVIEFRQLESESGEEWLYTVRVPS